MNLISCDECGVVLDADKLKFPSSIYDDDDDNIDDTKAAWDGDDYFPIVPCPVCKMRIFEPQKQRRG